MGSISLPVALTLHSHTFTSRFSKNPMKSPKYLALGLAALLTVLAAPAGAADYPNRHLLGINLDRPTDFDTSAPFADAMKSSRAWLYSYGEPVPDSQVDDLGNWIPEPGKSPFTIVALGSTRPVAGHYTVTWEGTGKVVTHEATRSAPIIEEGPNRLVFDLAADQGITLRIAESDPDDPVRNIRCFRPGTENQGHSFNPLFLEHLKPFGTIRYLNWIWANGSTQTNWDMRPVPEQKNFAFERRRGVPVEYIVELSNLTQTNPWVTIPHLADDDYVRNFARYMKDHLDPERTITIEYSNEIWNTAPGFGQTQYSTARGKEMGVPDNQRPHAAWYAKRSAEIWKIFEEVFGGRDRHVRVLSGFAVVPADIEAKIRHLGDSSLADAIAIAPYAGFSRDIRTGNFDPEGMTTEDLIEVMDGQIDQLVQNAVRNHARIAREHDLRLLGYEGGFAHGVPGSLHGNKQAEELFMAISTAPRLEDLLERYLRQWYAETGDLMCLYAYVRSSSRWGGFGNMGEDLAQPDEDAPRRRAIYDIASDPNLQIGNRQ